MRARIVASVALSAAITLLVAGCGFITPQATTDDYDASDGTNATIGDVKVLNAIVVSDNGVDGNLVTSVANNGSERVTVTFQFESTEGKSDSKVTVASGQIKKLGVDEVFLLEGINSEPGSLMPIFVQYGSETGKQVLVPVLDGSLPEYADLVP
ncbi:hypothetical protein [Homoserinimonas hongtaonis]|uniref:DNA modification methylase n=1 Tax=Homoserinimonas hongtaonis TaxID=2079791 RepID=A0A2U1T336_9MICO|nr:hypothetical protein [Salinibacterium hongtaonis]PWB98173.1 hypothetical protein DF220_10290 [Salinibacterium hongtaonis]